MSTTLMRLAAAALTAALALLLTAAAAAGSSTCPRADTRVKAGCLQPTGPAANATRQHSQQQLTVWAYERTWPALSASQQAALVSWFDIVLPPGSPGRWDAAYDLGLTGGRHIQVWAHTNRQTPPGRLAARPTFAGVRWQLWSGDGHLTFALPYGTELAAAQIPFRRWEYGTVHLGQMAAWLARHGYLPGRARVTSLRFGFQFAQPPAAFITVHRFGVATGQVAPPSWS